MVCSYTRTHLLWLQSNCGLRLWLVTQKYLSSLHFQFHCSGFGFLKNIIQNANYQNLKIYSIAALFIMHFTMLAKVLQIQSKEKTA